MSKYYNSLRKEIEILLNNNHKDDIYDIYHLDRVYKIARYINEKEQLKINDDILCLSCYICDLDIVFEDINDKNKYINKIFDELNLSDNIKKQIKESVEFAYEDSKELSIESKVLKDAINLDRLGAIGIGRAFFMGGYKKEKLYNPNVNLESNNGVLKGEDSSIVHYIYETLFKLEDNMETDIGRNIARKRINYMEEYLNKFFEEFEGVL